jgi:hypothetical protein
METRIAIVTKFAHKLDMLLAREVSGLGGVGKAVALPKVLVDFSSQRRASASGEMVKQASPNAATKLVSVSRRGSISGWKIGQTSKISDSFQQILFALT